MAKTAKLRPWTKADVRMLKTLAREKVKTTVIARKLKRTLGATYQKPKGLGVELCGILGDEAIRRRGLPALG